MDDDGNLPLRKQSSFELRAGYTTRMLEDKSWCCATLALENTADSIIDASRGTGTLKAAHNVSSHVPGSWKITVLSWIRENFLRLNQAMVLYMMIG